MDDVLAHKRCVPFRKFSQIGHTAQAKEFKATKGRWPEKSIRIVQRLLTNVDRNAVANGLNPDECYLTHIQVNRAQQGRRRTFRAHGRITPYLSSHCHIELFVTEKGKKVAKDTDKKEVRLTKKQAARQRLAIGGDQS